MTKLFEIVSRYGGTPTTIPHWNDGEATIPNSDHEIIAVEIFSAEQVGA